MNTFIGMVHARLSANPRLPKQPKMTVITVSILVYQINTSSGMDLAYHPAHILSLLELKETQSKQISAIFLVIVQLNISTGTALASIHVTLHYPQELKELQVQENSVIIHAWENSFSIGMVHAKPDVNSLSSSELRPTEVTVITFAKQLRLFIGMVLVVRHVIHLWFSSPMELQQEIIANFLAKLANSSMKMELALIVANPH